MWDLIGTALAQAPDGLPQLSEADKFKGLIWGGGILIVGGAIEIHTLLSNRLRAANSRAWPRIDGIVISRKMRRPLLSGFGRYIPQVRYQYTAGGELLEHDHVMFGGHTPIKREEAEAVLRRYPEGARVNVIHDPKNPKICALESRGAEGHSLFYGASMLFVGVVLLVAAALS